VKEDRKYFASASYGAPPWCKTGFLAAALLIVVATTAASCDWHSDFGYHKDCVLCLLAQLALVLPSVGFNLPPPVLLGCEIPLVQIFCIDSLQLGSPFTRGPPA
jgi:hypothetical protein